MLFHWLNPSTQNQLLDAFLLREGLRILINMGSLVNDDDIIRVAKSITEPARLPCYKWVTVKDIVSSREFALASTLHTDWSVRQMCHLVEEYGNKHISFLGEGWYSLCPNDGVYRLGKSPATSHIRIIWKGKTI